MRTEIRVVAMILGCVGATACATTTMNSMAAPEVSGRSFHTILVFGNFADLGVRQQAEERFVGANHDGHSRFVAASAVLFPGRQHTDSEVAEVLKANHIDAALILTPGQVGTSTTFVPPTYTSSCAQSAFGSCQQVTTKTTGGGSYAKPWAQFTAQLYDAGTGKVVWYGTATTGGNAFASAATLVHSMADKTIDQLGAAHLIR